MIDDPISFVPSDGVRREYAAESLVGLSVANALATQHRKVGGGPWAMAADIAAPPLWAWTGDTEMACSITSMLGGRGTIEPDRLAEAFARRCRPERGYAVADFMILRRIGHGAHWQQAATEAFEGQGSSGSGAAVRVAPLGAYFPDDLNRVVDEAVATAVVTHAHPEAVAGAVAVAVAASLACSARLAGTRPEPGTFIDTVRALVPPSRVHDLLGAARQLPHATVAEVAAALGSGEAGTAQDTVPLAIWVAARLLHDYPAAISTCLEAGGAVDATAAAVGGIVAAHTGAAGVPPDWLARREPLPAWA